VAAQTLPEENASTSVLKKLQFSFVGSVEHPEDGLVWEWQLSNTSSVVFDESKRLAIDPRAIEEIANRE
jgi:hypothetical protein